jgi:hypothetical protein
MKTLSKIQIKPEKIIDPNELKRFKGGETYSWLVCHGGTGICSMQVAWCDDVQNTNACNVACTGWTYHICVDAPY